MEHDDHGCTHSACECMQKNTDLMGKPSHLPPLLEGVKYLRSGYTKEYLIGENELFQIVREVINEIRVIRIFKEDEVQKLIEADSYQFIKYRNSAEVKDYQPRAGMVPLAKFGLKILMQRDSTFTTAAAPGVLSDSGKSKLIFYPHSGSSPDTSSFSRDFFHSHAAEFFKRVDASVNSLIT